MSIEISVAASDDAQDLARLGKHVHDLHVGWHPDIFRPATEEELADGLRALLAQQSFRAFLARREGRPVGYIGLRVVERPGHMLMFARRWLDVEQIGVTPDERGKGVGRALMSRARELAAELGLKRIELNVWAENEKARRSFESWGFAVCSSRMALKLEK